MLKISESNFLNNCQKSILLKRHGQTWTAPPPCWQPKKWSWINKGQNDCWNLKSVENGKNLWVKRGSNSMRRLKTPKPPAISNMMIRKPLRQRLCHQRGHVRPGLVFHQQQVPSPSLLGHGMPRGWPCAVSAGQLSYGPSDNCPPGRGRKCPICNVQNK